MGLTMFWSRRTRLPDTPAREVEQTLPRPGINSICYLMLPFVYIYRTMQSNTKFNDFMPIEQIKETKKTLGLDMCHTGKYLVL